MQVVVCPIARDVDVFVVMQRAHELAAALDFDDIDRTKIEIAVLELARNILAHARNGEQQIETVEAGGRRGIAGEARDSGPGIAPEHLPNVFERFYRGDPSRARATGGAGLGLTIVRQLVEAHGGRVWAESPPGQGAAFVFVLPTARPY